MRNNNYLKLKGGHSFEKQEFTNPESIEELKKFAQGTSLDAEKATDLLDNTVDFWENFWNWVKNLLFGNDIDAKYRGGSLKKRNQSRKRK